MAYKDALAGRIFTVDSTYHQYIKFISNEKYEFHYWRNPDTDHYYLIPSIDNGTFTVEGKEIKLSGGDSFKIVHNYLVKSTNSHSSNTGAIYFDNYSLAQTSQYFDDALTSYIEKIRKADPTLAKVELARVSLDYLSCKADKVEIEDPDNEFACTGTYVYYFNDEAAEKIIQSKSSMSPAMVQIARTMQLYALGFTDRAEAQEEKTYQSIMQDPQLAKQWQKDHFLKQLGKAQYLTPEKRQEG